MKKFMLALAAAALMCTACEKKADTPVVVVTPDVTAPVAGAPAVDVTVKSAAGATSGSAVDVTTTPSA